MKTTLLHRWRERTLREQRMLIALALLLVLALVWLLVIRPLDQSLAHAEKRHDAAARILAETRTLAQAIRTIERAGGTGPSGPLPAVISQAAAEAGFSIARLESDGSGGTTLVIDAARPQALFPWLARMEGSGALVHALATSANSDQTLKVQVTFRPRARI